MYVRKARTRSPGETAAYQVLKPIIVVAVAFVMSEMSAESAPKTPEKNAETMSTLFGCSSNDKSTDDDTIDMKVSPGVLQADVSGYQKRLAVGDGHTERRY